MACSWQSCPAGIRNEVLMLADGVALTSHDGYEQEIARGERFGFGKNWRYFLRVLDVPRIDRAEEALVSMLRESSLSGRSFLDIGCGSGLSSLVARRLGARVHSFDFDADSVRCAEELRRRFF